MGAQSRFTARVGKGSTFNGYIPRIKREVSVDLKESEPLPTGHERILYVDDERELVKISKKMLSQLGYRVNIRTSGPEALKLFRAQPNKFDLVITDLTMPKMTGEQFAKEIIRIRPEMPIILCTGFSAKVEEEEARTIGIKAFIIKPIVMREIALPSGEYWMNNC